VLLFLMVPCGFVGMRCSQSRGAPAETLATREWAAKIHAGWVGKVAAGSGALPTEMWSKEQIREKYGVLSAPLQTPTRAARWTTRALAARLARGAGARGQLHERRYCPPVVDHLTDADLKAAVLARSSSVSWAGSAMAPVRRLSADPVRAEWITAQMRAEVWGMLAAGDPARAARLRCARCDRVHHRQRRLAAQFRGRPASQLMVDPDIFPRAMRRRWRPDPRDSKLASADRRHDPCHGSIRRLGKDLAGLRRAYRDRSMDQRVWRWGRSGSRDWRWPEAEVLAEYLGRKNVLRTHTFNDREPAR